MPAVLVRRLALIALTWGCLSFRELPTAEAANPLVRAMTPPGARRGGEAAIVVTGQRLGDAQGILFYEPGMSLVEIKPASEQTANVKLAIAPDCRLGTHGLRFRTASGVSNMFLFSVGAMPEANEVEPNNDFAKPQPIALDTTVNGVIGNEDVDYFVVQAKKGEPITAEVEGIRLGRSRFDPYVAILDKDRFELANSDDSPLMWFDCVASVSAPEDGSYIVQVRESSFAGEGSVYRVHVGRYPRPRAVLPAGGRAGESFEVRWLGDLGGERVQKVTVPTNALPYYSIFSPDHAATGLFCQNDRGISPTPNLFRVVDLGNALETEPNDDGPTATVCEVPMALNGVISKPGDLDCFKFKAKKGEVFDIRVHARSIRSPLDPVLKIARIGGAVVGNNDDSGGPDSYLRFNTPVDDEYVLSVADLLKQGGPDYVYRVEVTRVAPSLVVSLPERRQYEDVTVVVPQGNRLAFMAGATRKDFGAEMTVSVKDLPAGVTQEAVPMAASTISTPVLLTAAADAPLAGSLADLVVTSADPKIPVTGHLTQTTMLVAGDNQRPVWTYTARRMATAVSAKVPFRIEIVQPKAPLVRTGSMELKIKAIREAGFKAPINVRMLYNPPGVASSASGSIPEGKDEATIPLTANTGAEIRSWKIAVLGEATVGTGPVLVSSQLADLQVADAFFQLAFKPAAAEQGKEAALVATVTMNADFPGPAKLELVGLPGEVTADAAEITKDSTETTLKVKTSAKSPAGRHKAIMCRGELVINGEPVVQMLGPAELRIDAPLPPKPTAKPAAPKPAAVAVAKPPVAKPLSRLEQLRMEREGGKPAEPAK
jgi:hypothetical protein